MVHITLVGRRTYYTSGSSLCCGQSMDLQGRCQVAQGTISHVDVKTEMVEKISFQDRLLDLCHNENPVRRSPRESECRDLGPIDSL